MVLLGFRQDPTIADKHWFLLQNSWKGLPLLEVSYEFLASHMKGGALLFVMGDISETAGSGCTGRGAAEGCCLLHGECSYNNDGGDGSFEDEDDNEEGT